MGLIATQSNCNTPVDIGSPLQVALAPSQMGLATSIAASGTINSSAIINGGYKSFSFSSKGTQAGNISIQRYMDQAATIVMGAAITASMSSNTDTNVSSVDGKPFQSMIITITNSGGSTSTLTNTLLLLQAS